MHESYAHERLKVYVCVLYDSLCAPLLLPWLGEVEGTSLAMSQAKASPVPAHVPMVRVPTVLRRVPSAVLWTVVGADFGRFWDGTLLHISRYLQGGEGLNVHEHMTHASGRDPLETLFLSDRKRRGKGL